MRRLPIRIRLTVVFSAAMAAVLAGAGLFAYMRVGADLNRPSTSSCAAARKTCPPWSVAVAR